MKKLATEVVTWVRNYLNSFSGNTKAVIGISGGKDSSVVAAICVEAIGRDRVIGVLMPDGEQHDIQYSKDLVEFLGIKSYTIDISAMTEASKTSIRDAFETEELSYVMTSNMPARIRMTTLYNVAAMIGDCRVANTCNRSEDYVGYSTKFGDGAGDFSPLASLCVREVLEIGEDLGLPSHLVHKVPEDGLSGKTDEENLGFTYAELDAYLLDGISPSDEKWNKIMRMHVTNLHKLTHMPIFQKPFRGYSGE